MGRGIAMDEASVIRFRPWARIQHALVIATFALLLLTGVPQKWPEAELSRQAIDLVGGIYAARWLHRAVGIGFSLLVVAHLVTVIVPLVRRRIQPTMAISLQDFRDAVHTLRYYVGREPEQPLFGRFDFRQKFEYWGMLFGSAIMVVTGLILLFPIAVSRLLPADLIPAAKAMHTNEAMLALAIIVVWHLYGAIFNPEVFPLDTSIFTGRISRERQRHEHPLEEQESRGER